MVTQDRTSALVRKMSVMPPAAASAAAAADGDDDEDDDVAIESVREVVAKQNSKVRREIDGLAGCCVE